MTDPEVQARRRDLAIDTMASWALEGLEPAPAFLERIQAYVDGRVTVQELIEWAKRDAIATASESIASPEV